MYYYIKNGKHLIFWMSFGIRNLWINPSQWDLGLIEREKKGGVR